MIYPGSTLNPNVMTVLKLNGVFSVIKPHNITSAECLNIIKANLIKDTQLRPDVLKVGHGGTLDKDATGVLAVGIGSGCKYLTKFIHGPKKYLCTSILGIETDTCYVSGNKINEKSFEHVTEELLVSKLQKFMGTIQQVPPIYSALKFKGRRLSDMAYAGEVIPPEKLQPRTVDVFDIQCIQFKLPSFTLDVSCGSGFYVRSLIRDLTYEMNTCAYVDKLERTRHGCFIKEHSLIHSQWDYNFIKHSIKFYKFHQFNF